jgi:hypothetical protein
MIVLTIAIYIAAGREILKSRRRLRSLTERFLLPPSMAEDQFDFSRTTEVPIADEAHPTPVQGASNLSPHSEAELDRILSPRSRDPSDAVDIGSGTALSSSTVPLRRPQSGAEVADERRRVSFEAHTAVWAYTKFAILFFIALLVTWVCLFIRIYHIIGLRG